MNSQALRKGEQGVLRAIEEQNRHGVQCLLTCRRFQKGDAESLVLSGHAARRACVKVDDNGFRKEPEVWTTGYELTGLGRHWLAQMRPDPSEYQEAGRR
jgi:hypothetical protein